jgi:penicillin amidase
MVITLLLVGVLIGALLRERAAARAAFPMIDGEIEVAGIADPVHLFRDRYGVPHAEAQTQEDALFALGFAHAQDRLAQMLWLLRSASGRTAEVVGPAGVASTRAWSGFAAGRSTPPSWSSASASRWSRGGPSTRSPC